jgi:hypothetical protein
MVTATEEAVEVLRLSLIDAPPVAVPVKPVVAPVKRSPIKATLERRELATASKALRPKSRHLEAVLAGEKRKEAELPKRVCHKCNQEGHFARNCPESVAEVVPAKASTAAAVVSPVAVVSAPKKVVVCHRCNKEGHFASNCPDKQAGKTAKVGTKGVYVCHYCGEEGHISKECPAKKAARATVMCFKCREEGHLAKDCPGERPCFFEAYHGTCGKGDKCTNSHDPEALRRFEEHILAGNKDDTCEDCGEQGHRKGYKRCPNKFLV